MNVFYIGKEFENNFNCKGRLTFETRSYLLLACVRLVIKDTVFMKTEQTFVIIILFILCWT